MAPEVPFLPKVRLLHVYSRSKDIYYSLDPGGVDPGVVGFDSWANTCGATCYLSTRCLLLRSAVSGSRELRVKLEFLKEGWGDCRRRRIGGSDDPFVAVRLATNCR